jgi:hypothetical protein
MGITTWEKVRVVYHDSVPRFQDYVNDALSEIQSMPHYIGHSVEYQTNRPNHLWAFITYTVEAGEYL